MTGSSRCDHGPAQACVFLIPPEVHRGGAGMGRRSLLQMVPGWRSGPAFPGGVTRGVTEGSRYEPIATSCVASRSRTGLTFPGGDAAEASEGSRYEPEMLLGGTKGSQHSPGGAPSGAGVRTTQAANTPPEVHPEVLE